MSWTSVTESSDTWTVINVPYEHGGVLLDNGPAIGTDINPGISSKQLSCSLWYQRANVTRSNWIIGASDGSASAGNIYFGKSDTRFEISWNNDSVTEIAKYRAANISDQTDWHHILFSFDLSSTSKRFVLLDGEDMGGTWTVYTDEVMNFDLSDAGSNIRTFFIGRQSSAASDTRFWGNLGEVWWAPGQYIDLSNSANIRKFRASDGSPIDLGDSGELPTGIQPPVYARMQFDDVLRNSGDGGEFELFGTVKPPTSLIETQGWGAVTEASGNWT